MNTLTCPENLPFDFLVTRQLVKCLNYKPQTLGEEIALSVIFSKKDRLRARSRSHLTEATDFNHQIRFSLKGRVIDQLRVLAHSISKNFKTPVTIQNALAMSEGDREFLNLLSEYLSNDKIVLSWEINDSEIFEIDLDDQETEMLSLIEKNERSEKLKEFAFFRLYAGDYWTARNILNHLYNLNQHDAKVNFAIGLINNFFSQTPTAEFHFLKSYEHGTDLDKVKSCYTLSMLYMRHHDKNLFDYEKATDYLQHAFEIINKPHFPDQTFQRVFNRNGYALAVFRHGQHQLALDHLECGIHTLEKEADQTTMLHVSVLQYNKCQCHVIMKQSEKAHESFLRLLEIDPLFPEYRIDYALFLIDQKMMTEAIDQLNKAIELNPYKEAAYLNLAYANLEIGQQRHALDAVSKGLKYLPKSIPLLENYLWLIETTDYEEKPCAIPC